MLLLLALLQNPALTAADTTSVPCDSVSPAGELPPQSIGRTLAGEYHLTLVSTWGHLGSLYLIFEVGGKTAK